MLRYSELLRRIAPVHSFDYAYMQRGGRRPDAQKILLETHREALARGIDVFGPNVVLAGKSMGGRISCHVALETPALGVICFGYPLVGSGKTSPIRDQVLLDMPLPALFIQGTRDPLCPLSLLGDVLTRRSGRSELYVVESGNHSLEPTQAYLRQQGQSAAQLEETTLQHVQQFVTSLLAT